jgi:hypothetical protein
MNYSEVIFYNPGVLKTQLSPEVLACVNEEVDRAIANKHVFNNELVGNIEREYKYRIPKSFYDCLTEMYNEYRVRYNYKTNLDFYVKPEAWVNLQAKHEFNPSHTHTGLASWVLWVKIPYDLTNEFNQPNVLNSTAKRASLFEFHYNTLDGTQNACHLNIDKSWEGTLIMFPATLWHTVYPFYTSDEFRISLAGNIYQA